MADWPANGDTDWNTKMLANLAVSHDTDGTHKAIWDINGSPTRVFTKYLTGTLDADSATDVAHGITGIDKILHSSVMVFNGTTPVYTVYEQFNAAAATISLQVDLDGTNVHFTGVGTQLQGQKYRIKLDYIL